MNPITAPADGRRENSFLIRNHSLSWVVSVRRQNSIRRGSCGAGRMQCVPAGGAGEKVGTAGRSGVPSGRRPAHGRESSAGRNRAISSWSDPRWGSRHRGAAGADVAADVGGPASGPSTLREIGKGALQAWQALSDAQKRKRGTADVAILFTDLVGFSNWALAAGDEAALDVLRQVGDVEQKAISQNNGAVVKRLGDGAMAVFSNAEQAVSSRAPGTARDFEDQGGGLPTDAAGGRAQRQAAKGEGGLPRGRREHRGAGGTARDCAEGGEVLVSGPAREELEGRRFRFGKARELDASRCPAEPHRLPGEARARALKLACSISLRRLGVCRHLSFVETGRPRDAAHHPTPSSCPPVVRTGSSSTAPSSSESSGFRFSRRTRPRGSSRPRR